MFFFQRLTTTRAIRIPDPGVTILGTMPTHLFVHQQLKWLISFEGWVESCTIRLVSASGMTKRHQQTFRDDLPVMAHLWVCDLPVDTSSLDEVPSGPLVDFSRRPPRGSSPLFSIACGFGKALTGDMVQYGEAILCPKVTTQHIELDSCVTVFFKEYLEACSVHADAHFICACCFQHPYARK